MFSQTHKNGNVTASKPATDRVIEHSKRPARAVFDRAPMLVYWEATQACDLACVHCRAEAVPQRSGLELSDGEARSLFQQIAQFGGRMPPHVVITGGDPLQRPDLFDLITYGRDLGLNISVTPAGTQRFTPDVVEGFKKVGVSSLALSLDGSNVARHDVFRGVSGSFQWTMDATRTIIASGIPLQINTMVTAQTLDDLPAIYTLLKDLGIARWALFFLISTGRGRQLDEITPEQCEDLLYWLWSRSRHSSFPIKTTEAHHYRRVVFTQMRARGVEANDIWRSPVGRGFGVRDGNGIAFVSHRGDVFPSGFLPLSAGNVRHEPLVGIYCDSPLFRSLRDVNRFKGKCGRCRFRAICGGSRARAYAATGDPLESDPLCPFEA